MPAIEALRRSTARNDSERLRTKLNEVIIAVNTGGGGGGSGEAAWGDITGTLSSQTDLQSALNGKAASSHTHAIENVTGLQAALDAKQTALVSGTSIKTVNGTSLLGSGNIALSDTFFDGGAASTVYAPSNRNIDGGDANG